MRGLLKPQEFHACVVALAKQPTEKKAKQVAKDYFKKRKWTAAERAIVDAALTRIINRHDVMLCHAKHARYGVVTTNDIESLIGSMMARVRTLPIVAGLAEFLKASLDKFERVQRRVELERARQPTLTPLYGLIGEEVKQAWD